MLLKKGEYLFITLTAHPLGGALLVDEDGSVRDWSGRKVIGHAKKYPIGEAKDAAAQIPLLNYHEVSGDDQ